METNCVQQVKPLASRFSGVLLDGCGELGSGKVLEQLIEQACDLYDWIALLWAAFGEAPSKELLANVNYRRALILISDCRNLFWTRVKQKFITVVSNLDASEPVWFGRERKKETLDEFFQKEMSAGQRMRIEIGRTHWN